MIDDRVAGATMEVSRRLSKTIFSNYRLGLKLRPHRQSALIFSRSVSSNASEKESVTLPKLPVPPLQQTLDKYLQTVEPFLNHQQYENTKQIVTQFGKVGGIGEKLQELLLKKYNETENWLAEWWLHYSYLTFRKPLIIFSSPGMVMPNYNTKNKNDVITSAAKVILAALNYKSTVDEGRLPLEKMGKAPLDMVQHGLMLGTCRIPLDGCDFLTYLPKTNQPKHVIVAHKNRYFKVDVYDELGRPYSETVLKALLNEILSNSSNLDVPIGILTAEDRDNWAKVYKAIRKNKTNAEMLDEIHKSLFLVCLDGPNSPSKDPKHLLTQTALQMIHGNGSMMNGGNRWYDKTVQFIVGTEGELGISYEHSPAEGPPIANLSDAAVDCIFGKNVNLKFSPLTKAAISPIQLKFELSEEVLKSIDDAKKHLDELVSNLDMSCFVFESFGKNYIKSRKLSPDSFIQMALQLAFYRLHNTVGAAYETASTRMYSQGRTETIRSASTPSLLFCKAMLDANVSKEVKQKSISVAIETHKRYVSEAVQGFGVDRHLLGLKLLASENNIEVPEIFKDIGFEKSSTFRLSTSQVSARHRSFMCYGPLVPNGYGCCYNPRDDDMIFGISAFKECKETSADAFRNALNDSLIDMQSVLGLEIVSKL